MTCNYPETRAAGQAARLAVTVMSVRKKAEVLAMLHTARASVNRRETGDRGRDHGGE